MRALVLTGPGNAEIRDVPAPVAGPGQVVVDVHTAGVCGTDVAFYRGSMGYLSTGQAAYPLRPGHEWAGVISATGTGVPETWLGARVTGDTMLGCGHCDRCTRGLQHVCADRYEVGVLHGWDGAVAEQVMVPASSLHQLPDEVTDAAGAMVEPGANAARAVRDARVGPGQRVAVIGPGTIGLIAAAFAAARGAEVHLLGRSNRGLALGAVFGAAGTWKVDAPPALDFQVVIEASGGAGMPQRAVQVVEPGGTVVCVGLAGEPTMLDTRDVVIKDVTLIGNLSGSPAMADTIAAFAEGDVDPVPLIAATVGLEHAGRVLAGWRPVGAGAGPKMLIDPRV